jgi:enterobactin synthetase component D / holo-[acyl-carrier protein] synthase
MIESLLPPAVMAVEAFDDGEPAPLFPEEEAAVARAVDKRRYEFATGRRCARLALERLGVPAGPVPVGSNREPLWPAGVVGSITHCAGYRAAAVARAGEVTGVGIDAEPHEALPDGLLTTVARPAEVAHLADLGRRHPEVAWDRLLFCAKEAVYKVWYPVTRRWLGFEEAEVVFDPTTGTFSAALLVPAPLENLPGRYLVANGLLLAAIAV